MRNLNKRFFEDLYVKFNRKDYIFSDPIKIPHRYKKKQDIEIVSLISSSLAYGNVKQILKSLENIFSKMGTSPYQYLKSASVLRIKQDFTGFKHRFTDAEEMSFFLLNIKKLIKKHFDIETCFLKHYDKKEEFIFKSAASFIREFTYFKRTPTLIPDPQKNSALKRFNLFLRWMIRKDDIDFGIWKKTDKSKLIIPLDTHMLAISKKLSITSRKDNSIKTALEITSFFKNINPADPVKYDFSITRAPILKNFNSSSKIDKI